MDTNPYYNPEGMGLEKIAEIEYSSGSYEFDTRVVWRHIKTGRWYTARDAGCSCPIPFDDYNTLEKLEPFKLSEIRTEVNGEAGKSEYSNVSPQAAAAFFDAIQSAKLKYKKEK